MNYFALSREIAVNGNHATIKVGTAEVPVYITDVKIEHGVLEADSMAINAVVNHRGGARYGKNVIDREFEIKRVIFNSPATIVLWADGSKTVVKAINEEYDPEKGLAMAFTKKLFGNTGSYYNNIKKWLPSEDGKDEI